MVTPFAHGAILRGSASARPVAIEALANQGNVLVLTPHPDDESLGCGGAIAAAAQNGRQITIVCLTDGAGSHPKSAAYPPKRLAALRLGELRKAANALTSGSAEVISVGLPDQGLSPRRLANAKVKTRLSALLKENDVRAIWTTWHGDPHVDHQVAAAVAKRLVECNPGILVFEFPVWGRFVEADLPPCVYSFDSGPYLSPKKAAMRAHASQMTHLITDDPSGFTMDPQAQQHFLEWPEIFIPSFAK